MPTPNKLRKFTIRAASIKDNILSGDASVIGNLDDYRTVMFPHFFDGVLPDFIERGFMADGHDWAKRIGTISSAEVQGRTLKATGEFYSTPRAQEIRTECMERKERGKTVDLSIGFRTAEQRAFKNGQELLDFAKRSNEDMSLFDVEGLSKDTNRMSGLIRCQRLYEFSPVPVGANDEAVADTVRGADNFSEENVDFRGKYLGEDIEPRIAIDALSSLVDRFFYRCVYRAICGSYAYDDESDEYVFTPPDVSNALIMISGGCDELKELSLSIVEGILTQKDGAETMEYALKSIRALFGDEKQKMFVDGARAASSFEGELDSVLAAVKSVTERAVAVQGVRTLTSRSISQDRVKQLKEARNAVDALISSIPIPMDTRVAKLALKAKATEAYAITIDNI